VIRAVLGSVTWRAALLTQTMALLFALAPWLESLDQPGARALSTNLLEQSLAALCVMLAALTADELVRRGWPVLHAFALALLSGCLTAACLDVWLDPRGTPEPLAQLAAVLGVFFGIGAYWGTPMLVYLNRQSAERLLANVEAGELRRVQTGRSLVESQLATAQAQLNPGEVMQQLGVLRESYASGNAGADLELERLIANLREKARVAK
jgi:hypothetical protein